MHMFILIQETKKVNELIREYEKKGKKVSPAIFDLNNYKKVKSFLKKIINFIQL